MKPETVIGLHRKGFELYRTSESRNRGGRPPIDAEIRTLIGPMAIENPTWGATRIHGELLRLGVNVGETTVSPTPRYVIRDRDELYGANFVRRVRAMGVEQVTLAIVAAHVSRRTTFGGTTVSRREASEASKLRSDSFSGGTLGAALDQLLQLVDELFNALERTRLVNGHADDCRGLRRAAGSDVDFAMARAR